MLLAPLCLFAREALAAETVDIGVLQDSELKVVQKQLYSRAGRAEVGAALGVIPFDAYTISPKVGVSGGFHITNGLGIELQAAGGYGLKTGVYNELAGPRYGVAVEAYRYLASAEAAVQLTPIYAKMNLGGKKVIHHDVYALVGGGVTMEQSVLPSADTVFAPTLPVGIGTRLYMGQSLVLRGELRDSVLYEYRKQSQSHGIKQNAAITLGVSFLTPSSGGGASK
jgi:outer membrane beta-barrel protein